MIVRQSSLECSSRVEVEVEEIQHPAFPTRLVLLNALRRPDQRATRWFGQFGVVKEMDFGVEGPHERIFMPCPESRGWRVG